MRRSTQSEGYTARFEMADRPLARTTSDPRTGRIILKMGFRVNSYGCKKLRPLLLNRRAERRPRWRVENAKPAKHFLRIDDRGGDLGDGQALLRCLLAYQFIGLDLADVLQADQYLHRLIDVAACLQRLFELLHLAFEPSRIAAQRAGEHQRGEDAERADRLVNDAVSVAVEQAFQDGGVLVVDNGDEGEGMVVVARGEQCFLRGFDKLEYGIDVVGDRRRRRPDPAHIAADALELVDQRLALAVARVDDEYPRAAKVLDQTADPGFHAVTAAGSLSQRPPIGETDRYGSALIGPFPSQTMSKAPSARARPMRGVSDTWLLSASIWIGPSGASRPSPCAASTSRCVSRLPA